MHKQMIKDIKLPIWITDTQDIILKVKETWMIFCDELQPASHYILNVDFCSYSLETENGILRGYYAKVIKIIKKKMDVVLETNDEN